MAQFITPRCSADSLHCPPVVVQLVEARLARDRLPPIRGINASGLESKYSERRTVSGLMLKARRDKRTIVEVPDETLYGNLETARHLVRWHDRTVFRKARWIQFQAGPIRQFHSRFSHYD